MACRGFVKQGICAISAGCPRFKSWLVPELKSMEVKGTSEASRSCEFEWIWTSQAGWDIIQKGHELKHGSTHSFKDSIHLPQISQRPWRNRNPGHQFLPRVFLCLPGLVLFTIPWCLLSEVISSLLAGLFWRSFLELGLSEACSVENPTSSRFLHIFVTPNGPQTPVNFYGTVCRQIMIMMCRVYIIGLYYIYILYNYIYTHTVRYIHIEYISWWSMTFQTSDKIRDVQTSMDVSAAGAPLRLSIQQRLQSESDQPGRSVEKLEATLRWESPTWIQSRELGEQKGRRSS